MPAPPAPQRWALSPIPAQFIGKCPQSRSSLGEFQRDVWRVQQKVQFFGGVAGWTEVSLLQQLLADDGDVNDASPKESLGWLRHRLRTFPSIGANR